MFPLKIQFFPQEPRTFPWLCSQWSSDCAGISSSLFERRKMHKMIVMVMMATFQIGPLDLRSTPWRTYISRWGPVRFPKTHLHIKSGQNKCSGITIWFFWSFCNASPLSLKAFPWRPLLRYSWGNSPLSIIKVAIITIIKIVIIIAII